MPITSAATTLEERRATLFKTLGEPNRLAIVEHLLQGEHRVADLVEHLGLAQSTVSLHVRWLRDAGLLDAHTHGRATFYTLAHAAATRSLLTAADHILTCTGEGQEVCDDTEGKVSHD